jgi:leucyl/phenylalanyl-tRNA--protein transferase
MPREIDSESQPAPRHDGPAAQEPPPGSDPQRPTAALLLWAYRNAIFPMADPRRGRSIDWFSPDPRAIIPLHPPDAFHVPRNLAREVRKGKFIIRSDTAFERVMRECASERGGDNHVWMNDTLLHAYLELLAMGHAHSIEAWLPSPRAGAADELVGGLYGVHIGGAFFGESMFSRPALGGSNSSKVCLVHLVRWLRARGFLLLDTQFVNDHIMQFGCIEIHASAYEMMLSQAIKAPVTWGDFAAH